MPNKELKLDLAGMKGRLSSILCLTSFIALPRVAIRTLH